MDRSRVRRASRCRWDLALGNVWLQGMCRVEGLWCGLVWFVGHGVGCRFWVVRCSRVYGSGFGVQGVGVGVWCAGFFGSRSRRPTPR